MKFNILNLLKVGHHSILRKMSHGLNDWNSLAGTKPLVGVVQMCSTNNKEDNLKQITSLVEKAHKRGAKMVFLPENCDFIGENTKETLAMAEGMEVDGGFVDKCRQLCQKYDIWMSVGSFHKKGNDKIIVKQNTKPPSSPIQPPSLSSSSPPPSLIQQPPTLDTQKIYNTQLIINNNGDIVSSYDKTHLFNVDHPIPMFESKFTHYGSTIQPPIQTPVGKVGMAICYDLRFPEHSTRLRLLGADVITYPSAFTVPTGLAHWEVLLRARAIETQCYVVAAAQAGKHNVKRSSYGHAMLIDPWGTVRAQCQSTGPDVCFAEIDLDLLSSLRGKMPVMEHRRSDLYGNLIGTSVQTVPISTHTHYDFGGHSIPASCIIISTTLSYAFVNKSPVFPGHILVSPLRRVGRVKDLTLPEVHDLYACVKLLAPTIENLYKSTSLTISTQDGPQAGQTVEHVHVHIVPRKEGDFDDNDDIYDKLEKHDKTERRVRSVEEMEEECVCMREALRREGVEVGV